MRKDNVSPTPFIEVLMERYGEISGRFKKTVRLVAREDLQLSFAVSFHCLIGNETLISHYVIYLSESLRKTRRCSLSLFKCYS